MIGIGIGYHQYLKRLGLYTVPATFYSRIRLWESWYRSNVRSFHSYRVHTGKGSYQTCKRRSLGMAKKVCEDAADFLLNERVRVTLSDPATDAYVASVLSDNNFRTLGNEYQERKAATGTAAYVPYLVNIEADGEGSVIGADIRIGYFDAAHIFPIHWIGRRVIDCAFATEAWYKGQRYAMIQIHRLDCAQYVIDTKVIDNFEHEVSRAVWDSIPQFAGIPSHVETGSPEPQFVIDRLAIANNVADDKDCPLGIPIFANAIDVLEKLDIEYDSYANEFLLGRKRLLVAPEMMQDENGNLVFDPADGVFYCLPEDFPLGDHKAIQEIDMSIRAEQHEKAINQDLEILSLKCGFGSQYYRFDRSSMATATQVISENSDLYRTIRKHEIPLATVIENLIGAIIRLGMASGVPGLVPSSDITIGFDDSIIEDKATERKQDREDVAMGVMGLAEYRAKWYGETEEVAASRLPDVSKSTSVIV